MLVEPLHLLDLGGVLVAEVPAEEAVLRHQLDLLALRH